MAGHIICRLVKKSREGLWHFLHQVTLSKSRQIWFSRKPKNNRLIMAWTSLKTTKTKIKIKCWNMNMESLQWDIRRLPPELKPHQISIGFWHRWEIRRITKNWLFQTLINVRNSFWMASQAKAKIICIARTNSSLLRTKISWYQSWARTKFTKRVQIIQK